MRVQVLRFVADQTVEIGTGQGTGDGSVDELCVTRSRWVIVLNVCRQVGNRNPRKLTSKCRTVLVVEFHPSTVSQIFPFKPKLPACL